jgi:hypothetical protein
MRLCSSPAVIGRARSLADAIAVLGPVTTLELPFVSVRFRVSNWLAVTKLSRRKLQLSLNRLKARLLAQGVHERISLEVLQALVP